MAMDPVKLREFALAVLDLVDDSRSEVQEVVRTGYDLFIEPYNLPGPDEIIDPLFEKGATIGAGSGYDSLLGKLREWAGIVSDDADRNSKD